MFKNCSGAYVKLSSGICSDKLPDKCIVIGGSKLDGYTIGIVKHVVQGKSTSALSLQIELFNQEAEDEKSSFSSEVEKDLAQVHGIAVNPTATYTEYFDPAKNTKKSSSSSITVSTEKVPEESEEENDKDDYDVKHNFLDLD